MRKASAIALVLALGLTASFVVGSAFAGKKPTPVGPLPGAEASACRCPLVYAPVICDNGRTYPNPCVADCRHAKNCVPTGEL